VSPVRPQWFYTYVLVSAGDRKWYTGVTRDTIRRLKQHNAGLVSSTKHRVPLKMVYFEACLDKDDAYRREKYLKTGMGKRYLRNRLKGGLTG
jgi:putative endonuclease